MAQKDSIRVDAATNLAAFAFGSSDEVIAKIHWDTGRECLVVESAVTVEVQAERVYAVRVESD